MQEDKCDKGAHQSYLGADCESSSTQLAMTIPSRDRIKDRLQFSVANTCTVSLVPISTSCVQHALRSLRTLKILSPSFDERRPITASGTDTRIQPTKQPTNQNNGLATHNERRRKDDELPRIALDSETKGADLSAAVSLHRRPRGLTFTWWGCCGLCF